MKHINPHIKAIGFSLTAFTLWVISDSFLKLAGEFAIPKYQIMLLGSMCGGVSLFIFTAVRGNVARFRPRHVRELLILGILSLFTISCWVIVLPHLPLTGFYTVGFTMPMLIAVLAALLLHEQLGWRKAFAIIAGFGGVIIALNPSHLFGGGKDWINYAILFAGVLSLAFQMLLLRILGEKESRESTVFYPRVIMFTAGLAATGMWGFVLMTITVVLYSLAYGFIGALGWLFMAEAYKCAPAATVAPFHYSQIVTGALFGYLIWHDVPSWHLVAGAVIIIASGLYIIRHTQKSAAPEEVHD